MIAPSVSNDAYPIEPLARVDRVATVHRWEDLTFVHARYAAADVQRLLPEGLTVDTFDGDAWVGLVAFRLRIRVSWAPFLPWVSTFAETNVRTYVRGPDGTPGIWFMSLDAARLGAVVVARSSYGLPYTWARMRVVQCGDVVTYASRRRWPGAGPSTALMVELGRPVSDADYDPLARFLTARWNFFCMRRTGGLGVARAEHPRWPLREARVLHWTDGLVAAVGLPDPSGELVAHYSESVDARVGRMQAAAQ